VDLRHAHLQLPSPIRLPTDTCRHFTEESHAIVLAELKAGDFKDWPAVLSSSLSQLIASGKSSKKDQNLDFGDMFKRDLILNYV